MQKMQRPTSWTKEKYMNEFTLVGTIEELMPMMETSNGISVINFVVRTEKGYISKKENLLKISAFKELAEETEKNGLHRKVLIKGRIADDNFDKDGKKLYSAQLIAEKIFYLMQIS